MALLLGVLVVVALITVMTLNLGFFNQSSEKKTQEAINKGWSVFESYLNYAGERNLEGVASLSHELGPVCKDPEKKEECNALLDTVAFLGTWLKKEEFTTAWYDKKQLIILTEYQRREDDDGVIYVRGAIYFTKNDSGELKLLSFNPSDGIVILKKEGVVLPTEEEFQKMVLDSDYDSIPDETETCSDKNETKACLETNPNKRDSDGDGWWDSIERLFR